MKNLENFKKIIAVICVLQVCLLVLTAVSPSLHYWIFHPETSQTDHHQSASSSHCTHGKHTCTHGEEKDGSEEQHAHNDASCAVTLFASGILALETVDLTDLFLIEYTELVLPEPLTRSSGLLDGRVRARAPPA